MKKLNMNGHICCSVGDAAKYLGTNALGIKKLINEHKLNFETNGHLNSSRIYIHVSDLIGIKHGNEIE